MSVELATAYVNLVSSAKGMGKDIEGDLGEAGDRGGKVGGEKAGTSFVGRLGGILKKSVVGLGVAAGATVGGLLVKGLVDSFAQSDATTKFQQSLDFAGLAKSQVDQATKITQKYADDTVFDLSTVQNTAAQLAANGVKDFTGLTMAAGNLNAVAGGNADTFRGVAMALTQTVGAGKLTTENWNQIADAIPGASGVLQAALKKNGAFTGDFRDAMAKSQITAKEFNKALMQVGNRPIAKQAATSTATFEGAMGNLMATITGGFAGLLNKAKPQLTGFITSASGIVDKGFKAVSGFAADVAARAPKMWAQIKASPAVQASLDKLGQIWDTLKDTAIQLWPSVKQIFTSLGQATKQLGVSSWSIFLDVAQTLASALQKTLVPALKWLADFLKNNPKQVMLLVAAFTAYKIISTTITTATKLWAAAQKLLNLAMKANPIGLVIAGLTALAAGFLYLWEHSKSFRDFWIGLWDKIKKVVGAVVDWFKDLPDAIGRIFTSVIDWFEDLPGKIWGGVKSGAKWLTTKAGDLIGWILAGIKNVASNVWDWFKGLPGKAWAGVKALSSTIVGYGTSLLTWIWNGIKGIAGKVWSWFTGIPTSIWNVIKGLGARLGTSGRQVLSFIWDGIKGLASKVWSWFTGVPGQIWNVIKGLGARLGNSGRKVLSFIWDGIKGLASSVWNWFTGIPSHIWNVIKGLGARLGASGQKILSFIWSGIKGIASNVWNWFTGIPSHIWNVIKGLGSRLGESGRKILTSIKDGIVNAATAVWTWFSSIPSKIWHAITGLFDLGKKIINEMARGMASAVNSNPVFSGLISLFGGSGFTALANASGKGGGGGGFGGQFANGGVVPNGWFTMNERGPELGYKQGSHLRIFSNGESQKLAPALMAPPAQSQPAGRTVTVYAQTNADPWEIARETNRVDAFLARV